jgi:hypothetical protein
LGIGRLTRSEKVVSFQSQFNVLFDAKWEIFHQSVQVTMSRRLKLIYNFISVMNSTQPVSFPAEWNVAIRREGKTAFMASEEEVSV